MQTASAPSFRTHISPAQVSPQVRQRMVHEFSRDQGMWTGIILVLAVLTSLGVSLAYRWEGLKTGSEWIPIVPILAAAVIILSLVSAFYDRKRHFVTYSPATWAVVVREKELETYTDDSTIRIPRLYLRYLPGHEEIDLAALHDPKQSFTAWVNLRGLSCSFEQNVRPGDLVTVLYDKKDPHKIMVVEYEQ